VTAGRPEVAERAETAALTRLRTAGATIVAGIERCVDDWVVAQVGRILDAWGQADATTRARADGDARVAGQQAAARVTGELRALLALDPVDQRSTPLEVVRTAVREPTQVLEAAGVPPVVRDDFDERAFPGDHYGLVPRTLGDLGDESLAPLHLEGGLAKAAVLRARSEV
jgi:hypothetical protein